MKLSVTFSALLALIPLAAAQQPVRESHISGSISCSHNSFFRSTRNVRSQNSLILIHRIDTRIEIPGGGIGWSEYIFSLPVLFLF